MYFFSLFGKKENFGKNIKKLGKRCKKNKLEVNLLIKKKSFLEKPEKKKSK